MTIYNISSGEDIDAAMLKAMILSIKPSAPTIPGRFEVSLQLRLNGVAAVVWHSSHIVSPSGPHQHTCRQVAFSKLHLAMLFNRPGPAAKYLTTLRKLYLR